MAAELTAHCFPIVDRDHPTPPGCSPPTAGKVHAVCCPATAEWLGRIDKLRDQLSTPTE